MKTHRPKLSKEARSEINKRNGLIAAQKRWSHVGFMAVCPCSITRERLRGRIKCIIRRCTDPKDHRYYDYGGKGITVYEPWLEDRSSFMTYLMTLDGYDNPNLTIDRIDNNAGYVPDNLRFADKVTQYRNQRWLTEGSPPMRTHKPNTYRNAESKVRRSPANRGYDYRWQKFRAAYLSANPLCLHCDRKAATQIDHIKPVESKDDPLFYEESNLQALCSSCHSKKTVRQDGGFGRYVTSGC